MKALNLKVLVFKVFKRPKVLILASLIAVILSLILSVFLLPAHYLATGKILVRAGIIGEGGSEKEELLLSERTLNTTVELLKSPSLIKEVVEELNLEDAFGQEAVDKTLSMLRVSPIRKTNIIEVSVRAKQAEVATLIANTMCKVAITRSAKESFSFRKDILSWLSKKAADIKKELEDSRNRLLEFKQSVGTVDLETGYNADRQHLSGLESNLSALRRSREELESTYTNIESFLASGKGLEELPPVISDTKFKELQSKYIRTKGMIDELLKKYQPSHPEVAKLEEELTELKVSFEVQARELIEHYKTTKAEEEKLQKLVEEENKKVLDLEQKLNQYKVLLDGLREKEALFDTFLENMEKEFTGGLKVQQLSLAEQAYLPQKKKGPPTGLIVLSGLLIGMVTTLVHNILKDKNRLFVEKREAPSPKEKAPAKEKGMYIERVGEEEE